MGTAELESDSRAVIAAKQANGMWFEGDFVRHEVPQSGRWAGASPAQGAMVFELLCRAIQIAQLRPGPAAPTEKHPGAINLELWPQSEYSFDGSSPYGEADDGIAANAKPLQEFLADLEHEFRSWHSIWLGLQMAMSAIYEYLGACRPNPYFVACGALTG